MMESDEEDNEEFHDAGEDLGNVNDNQDNVPEDNHVNRENNADGSSNGWGRAFFTGIKSFTNTVGSTYKIVLKPGTSSVVRVVDTSLPRKVGAVFRLDNLHPGKVNYNHININPRISGLPDPHLPLPPGGLPAGTAMARSAQVLNAVAGPLLIGIEGLRIGKAVYQDYNEGTTDNTKETVIGSASTWGCGLAGAEAGGAIGTLLLPGVGTIVGGIVGGIAGSIAGSVGGTMISDRVVRGNQMRCSRCGRWILIQLAIEALDQYFVCSDCYERGICRICGRFH